MYVANRGKKIFRKGTDYIYEVLKKKGGSLESRLNIFRVGFPAVKLLAAATFGKGQANNLDSDAVLSA